MENGLKMKRMKMRKVKMKLIKYILLRNFIQSKWSYTKDSPYEPLAIRQYSFD